MIRVFPDLTQTQEFYHLGQLGHFGALNDRQQKYLKSLGYSGVLSEALYAYHKDNLKAPLYDFAFSVGVGDYPTINLARSTVGTYVTEAGLIATAGVNERRYDWSTGQRALLIEGAATNLVWPSDMSSGWANSANTSQSADAGTAPNGSDMRKLLTTSPYAVGEAELTNNYTGAVVGQTYAVSVFARRDQNRYMKLKGFGNGPSGVGLDLATGGHQVNSAWLSSGVDLLNDQHCRAKGVVKISTNIVLIIGMSPNIAGAAGPWLGGENLSFWGAQIEAGTKHTSYIPTTGGSATRAADVPSIALAAGTYDVRVVTSAGTTTYLSVAHAGGAYWPAAAVGHVYRLTIKTEGGFA